MVVIRAARTLPVNPAEAAPVITHDQLWHALQRKIRYATEFVPAIQHCKVVSDKGEEVVRDCVLVHASGERRYMRETVTSHGKQWILFTQEDRSVTTNLVSYGRQGQDEDLLLTYIFEWQHPNVEQSSMKYQELIEDANNMALLAVQKSIETARRMVSKGMV